MLYFQSRDQDNSRIGLVFSQLKKDYMIVVLVNKRQNTCARLRFN